MYKYDEFDHQLLEERVRQFRGQVERYQAGEIPEDEFKALRLRNGLYYQRHAYMLRVAVPYGLLSSPQLRVLARIARDYDRGYGHFTTRQNIQYNWPELGDVPDILELLRQVEMHAIQTSGNTIRNISSDHLAGVAADELEDPRPYCEILRQWSTLHPEFAWLPRKFKIAVTGSDVDRVALKLHDIGLQIIDNAQGQRGFRVYVGGGMGRTPIIGKVLREFLPKAELLTYMDAILRIYNLEGRRDNIHKARIKILVQKLGIEEFARRVEEEWQLSRNPDLLLSAAEIDAMAAHFQTPNQVGADQIGSAGRTE
ncbi:MAG: nitrite/sulfite reductase, partial [Mariprofundaceae bacterium]|nr:nitrite/sulfite reductase [Mariprofundaceae bacterium]